MAKLNTCPAIVIMVARILSHGGNTDIDYNIPVNSRVDLFLCNAMSEQYKIGWTAFIQGFHSRHWMITQNEYCSDAGLSSYVSTGNVWASRFIGLLYDYADDIWKHRNGIVHGTKIKESRQVRLARLQQKVKEYYDKPRTFLTRKEKKFFTLPVTQRLKTGTYRLKIWLEVVDHIYFDDKEQRTQGTSRSVMKNWLYNTGNSTDMNDVNQEYATLHDHNRIDDTQRRAIHAIAEENTEEDKRMQEEEE
jgi:hypothetical protein